MIVSYSLQLEFLSQAVTISDLFRVDGNVYFYVRRKPPGSESHLQLFPNRPFGSRTIELQEPLCLHSN